MPNGTILLSKNANWVSHIHDRFVSQLSSITFVFRARSYVDFFECSSKGEAVLHVTLQAVLHVVLHEWNDAGEWLRRIEMSGYLSHPWILPTTVAAVLSLNPSRYSFTILIFTAFAHTAWFTYESLLYVRLFSATVHMSESESSVSLIQFFFFYEISAVSPLFDDYLTVCDDVTHRFLRTFAISSKPTVRWRVFCM